MTKIKQADYEKIHRDFRGMLYGKRSCFAGCIIPGGGTRLVIEGVDFEVIPTPQPRKRQPRRR